MKLGPVSADPASCAGGGSETGDTGADTCNAEPACTVEDFLDQALSGLEGHVRSTEIFRANNDEPAVVAAEVREYLADLAEMVCG